MADVDGAWVECYDAAWIVWSVLAASVGICFYCLGFPLFVFHRQARGLRTPLARRVVDARIARTSVRPTPARRARGYGREGMRDMPSGRDSALEAGDELLSA